MPMNSDEKLKIIVADDHPVFREGIFATIQNVPFVGKIMQASNGEEVISLLEKEPADIVLMDIKMEPMNGIETTEVISEKFPGVKVIALSMFAEEKYILQLVKLGAVGYLIKNASKGELIEAIETVSRGKNYFTRNVSEVLYEKLMKVAQSNDKELAHSKEHVDKLNEIIYMMYLQKTSQEIADALCLSRRTVEDYRLEILRMTNSKNIAGVIKYAYETGITEDLLIKSRVENYLEKRGS